MGWFNHQLVSRLLLADETSMGESDREDLIPTFFENIQ